MYFRLEISRKMLAANPLGFTALLKSVSLYSLPINGYRNEDRKSRLEVISMARSNNSNVTADLKDK